MLEQKVSLLLEKPPENIRGIFENILNQKLEDLEVNQQQNLIKLEKI
jgi:hypothetical protein